MTQGAFFVFLHFGQHFLLRSLGQSSEVEHNPKMNISFFNDLGDHSELVQWEKIVKVVNQVKLALPSHSEPLQWGKIGKVMNWAKLAILIHSELLQCKKIGKVANQVKLAIQSHSEPLW